MKNNATWKENLILAGFLPEQIDDNHFILLDESKVNISFLTKLLNESGIQHSFEFNQQCLISLYSEAPSRQSWLSSIAKVGGKVCGLMCRPGYLELEILDTPMLSAVRQLNRLGLSTSYSCTGHDKSYAEIHFWESNDAMKASELLNRLGFHAKCFKRKMTIYNSSRLIEMGLVLSKLDCIENQKIEALSHTLREELLEKLLMIPGTSGNESRVRDFLWPILEELTDHAFVGSRGNLLAMKKMGRGPCILLSAHMDVVEPIPELSTIIKDSRIWHRNQGILGADDRAGLAMIVSILKSASNTSFRGTLKIAFTTEEEVGQRGAESISPLFFWDVDCAISLDRRNGSDIVTSNSKQRYCSEVYGKIFEQVSKDLWSGQADYTMVEGGVSDLRVWSSLGVESVNLSIGYHNEHTPTEYLNLTEWHRTHDLVMKALPILTSCRGRVGYVSTSSLKS